MTGGDTTVMLAFDVLPVPPSLDVTVTELFLMPAVVPVTSTLKVIVPLAATVAPDRLMEVAPAVAVTLPPPGLALLSPLGVATTRPAGRLSVKATLVRSSDVFG